MHNGERLKISLSFSVPGGFTSTRMPLESLGGPHMPVERFEFEDFELDRSAYELRRAGTVVRIERIPLELLFLLIERRGQLVTRQEIFERIWGKGVFVDTDNSINTAVRKLRRALHDPADAPRFVAAVPAKGYRFIAPIREDGSTAPVPAAGLVSAVPEASPTADAVDPSSTTITKADMPLRKERRRGILWSIGGIAFVIAVIVLIQQLSLRPPTTTASIPTTQSPALPLPDKPSIAVLPFTNMSGDRDQEYFSDGITDDLITALSKLAVLFVIARNSIFTYKGKAVKVQQVGRELGVQYVLGAVCARRVTRSGSTPSWPMRPPARTCGPSVTTGRCATSFRCRTARYKGS